MTYLKWSVSVFVLVIIVILSLYKPFYKTEVKQINVNKFENNISIFKNKNIYLVKYNLKKEDIYLFINRKKKTIYEPNYNNINLNNIILWRRDMLKGVPISSAAKVEEQEMIWQEDSVNFTYGKDSSFEYYIEW
ncbi:MAG: hypothetical protein ACOC1O_03945 [bacterium]